MNRFLLMGAITVITLQGLQASDGPLKGGLIGGGLGALVGGAAGGGKGAGIGFGVGAVTGAIAGAAADSDRRRYRDTEVIYVERQPVQVEYEYKSSKPAKKRRKQDDRVTALEQENTMLRSENTELEARIEELEYKLENLQKQQEKTNNKKSMKAEAVEDIK
jgi:uncharacterized protein YcfJ